MDEKTRIEKDINMFEENIDSLQKNHPLILKDPRAQMATDYYHDAQYYLEKRDYFTAFGCINYGHGLLDALIKFDDKKLEETK
jgi:hypothetical protein